MKINRKDWIKWIQNLFCLFLKRNVPTYINLNKISSLVILLRKSLDICLLLRNCQTMDYCDNSSRLKLFSGIDFDRVINSTTERDKVEVQVLYEHFCPILLLGCAMGLVLNLTLIIISRTRLKVVKTPVFRLSLNLAMTDALASLLSGTSIALNSYLPIVYNFQSNPCAMLILEVFRLSAFMSSTLHLLALGFVHYNGALNPLQSR